MCKGNNNWGMPQDGIADTLTQSMEITGKMRTVTKQLAARIQQVGGPYPARIATVPPAGTFVPPAGDNCPTPWDKPLHPLFWHVITEFFSAAEHQKLCVLCASVVNIIVPCHNTTRIPPWSSPSLISLFCERRRRSEDQLNGNCLHYIHFAYTKHTPV